MTTPDSAQEHPRQDPVSSDAVAPSENAENTEVVAAGDSAEGSPEQREPIVHETRREVSLQRSVRFGRIMVVGAIIGAVLAVIASLSFPVVDEAEYSMGQIVAFMALVGGIIGLCAGALLSLILGLVARRSRGTGIAIQSDVR
jgi:hypothetical protein